MASPLARESPTPPTSTAPLRQGLYPYSRGSTIMIRLLHGWCVPLWCCFLECLAVYTASLCISPLMCSSQQWMGEQTEGGQSEEKKEAASIEGSYAIQSQRPRLMRLIATHPCPASVADDVPLFSLKGVTKSRRWVLSVEQVLLVPSSHALAPPVTH